MAHPNNRTARSLTRLWSLRYFGLLVAIGVAIAGVAATALMLPKGSVVHKLAGLPHWTTACPKEAVAILVMGQSHASNTGPQRHIAFSRSRAFADGHCYYLRDPMPGTDGRGGSVWPEFADEIGQPAVIADIAISGSGIRKWTTPDQLEKVRRTLRDMHDAGYPKPLIILMQGETDYVTRTSAQNYYSQLRKLVDLAPDHRWLIARESVCKYSQTPWKPLDLARDRIARQFDTVTVGPDIDSLGLQLRQADQCHFNVQGQTVLASSLAKAARPQLNH